MSTTRLVGGGLVVSLLGSIGLAVVAITRADTQLQGLALGAALLGLAFALGAWARRDLPSGRAEEPRPPMPSGPAEREAFLASLTEGERLFSRRKGLAALLALAGGALAAVALSPIRSLGPRPEPLLRSTPWRAGRRLVTEDGAPVRVDELDEGGVLTVFPEGDQSPGDAQVILLRLDPGDLHLADDRADWAPEGNVAYSKLCTHAGCPVGLFEAETRQLLCPCHQSVFAADEGARVLFGPAPRSLPQLPLDVDEEGYLVARGDFPEPVGPGYWERG